MLIYLCKSLVLPPTIQKKKNVCIRITEEADVVVSERAWNFMVNLFNQCNDYFMLFFPICALQTGGPRTT